MVFEIHARFASPRDLCVPSSKSQNIMIKKYTFGQINGALRTQIQIWRSVSTIIQVSVAKRSSKRHIPTFLGQFMRSECYHSLAAQTLMGVRWNLNFVRECMKINKYDLNHMFWKTSAIKMTHLVFLFCVLPSVRF